MRTGGKLVACWRVSSDTITIQMSGTSMIAATGARNRCQPLKGSRPRRRCAGASGRRGKRSGTETAGWTLTSVRSRGVVDPPPPDPQLDQGDDEDGHE